MVRTFAKLLLMGSAFLHEGPPHCLLRHQRFFSPHQPYKEARELPRYGIATGCGPSDAPAADRHAAWGVEDHAWQPSARFSQSRRISRLGGNEARLQGDRGGGAKSTSNEQ